MNRKRLWMAVACSSATLLLAISLWDAIWGAIDRWAIQWGGPGSWPAESLISRLVDIGVEG